MKKHHINRLEKLYKFLGTVKPKKFNFGSWAISESGIADVNVCGTTACALGWAGTIPEFRKRGLKLVWWENIYGELEAEVRLDDHRNGEHAGAAFFGLTHYEACYLFIPDCTTSMHMPLSEYRRRLRGFINKKKRELKIA